MTPEFIAVWVSGITTGLGLYGLLDQIIWPRLSHWWATRIRAAGGR